MIRTVPVLVLVLSSALAAQSSYVPVRVFDTKTGAWADFEVMAADLARADAVFVGEQHDDPNTHALERALLESIARRRTDIVVSLEMFERDTQAAVDAYLSTRIDEAAFLKDSRPWKTYAGDYRPLVEIARDRRWPVIAANVPKELASAVAKAGLDALLSLTPEQKSWIPADISCPKDAYFERFVKTMGGHPAGDATEADQRNIRYYQAQCLKDEAMGEAVARAAQGPGEGPLVVHYNGAFHSDFALGAAERAKRRLPGSRVAVITMLPVASVDGLAPTGEDRKRADYLVYTIKR